MILPALLLSLDEYSSWRVGGGCSNEGYSIRFCCTQVISEAPAVFNMIV